MAAPIIICDTAGMTNEQWLEARMHGPHGKIPYTVGGSDVAAIFGVSPWTTPLELWNIKKGRMKPPKKANANQLEMGHLLEPIAAHWYAKKTGNIVTVDTNLYQHADHPYALANFDRRFTRVSDGVPGILECKSCTFHKSDEWADGAIPLYYELQLRFYLAVQVRRDNVTKRKFRWISSTDQEDGCRAEAWTHLIGSVRPTLVLTEGPMKADVINALTGMTVLAVPGVNTLTQLEITLTELRREGLVEIKTAFDMDFAVNHHVQNGYNSLLELLGNMGFRYGTYLWDPNYKGLDDYIWECCFQRKRSQ